MELSQLESQMRAAEEARHRDAFRSVIGVNGDLTVKVEDINFALKCSPEELRMIAMAACAQFRILTNPKP